MRNEMALLSTLLCIFGKPSTTLFAQKYRLPLVNDEDLASGKPMLYQ